MATLQLEIVTPERKEFSEEVEMVVIPGLEGELGVLPNHVPLMTTLKPGELTIVQNGECSYLAVGKGFAEITQDRVSILTDMAVKEREIDEMETEAAIERARKAMEERLGKEEVATVEAALEKSLAKLHVKRRRRTLNAQRPE